MTTKIEWVTNKNGTKGETWNPITGCSKISAGCANCYAERMSKRLAGRYGYPKDDPFKVTFHPDKLDQPLHWLKPRRIFVCSMGDLFHDDVEWNWQYKVFEIMFINPDHTYIVLTKRPKRMQKVLPDIWFHLGRNYGIIKGETDGYPFPLKNLWIGVTVENQKIADERIPILMHIPASKRFISVEPMLADVDIISPVHRTFPSEKVAGPPCFINWVICGCESGSKRRLTNIDWIRNLRDQCVDFNIPFFLKQMEIDGKIVSMSKLDGTVWNQYPE